MDKHQLAEKIQTYLRSEGADIVGFADLRSLPADIRSDYPYGISIAVALDPGIIRKIIDGPDIDYLQEYKRANELLGTLSDKAARFLEEHGQKAKSFSATNTEIDRESLSTALPHKTVATRAGLGWIGKCALLITPEYGSQVRLRALATTAPLICGEPILESEHCNNCNECIESCPADAFVDGKYTKSICYDYSKSNWKKLSGYTAIWCNVCIEACPVGKKVINDE